MSVSDKTDSSRSPGLAARGFELVSTGGTARALRAGLPVVSVSDVTGFPEMMDGRVKTLHPRVHGGILARRDVPTHLAALEQHGIGLIDVVVVNLYPFATAAANPATPFEELVEEIDIGGPSLVRAAAKNFRDVLVVVVAGGLCRGARGAATTRRPDAGVPLRAGAQGVRAHRGLRHGDRRDARRRDGGRPGVRAPTRRPVGAAPRLTVGAAEGAGPALRREPAPAGGVVRRGRRAPALGAAPVLQGKELSYTNLLDLDAAARIVLEFDEPAAAVIKHTNPCGAATGATRRRCLRARARGRSRCRRSAASSRSTGRSTSTTARGDRRRRSSKR